MNKKLKTLDDRAYIKFLPAVESSQNPSILSTVIDDATTVSEKEAEILCKFLGLKAVDITPKWGIATDNVIEEDGETVTYVLKLYKKTLDDGSLLFTFRPLDHEGSQLVSLDSYTDAINLCCSLSKFSTKYFDATYVYHLT